MRPGGRLVFSTNYTRFKLDAAALEDLNIEDISAQTIPRDFERHAKIHRCFVVRFKELHPFAPVAAIDGDVFAPITFHNNVPVGPNSK
jgi:hypothetical protein